MRFGLAHRLATDALATLGLLALITGSDVARPFAWAVLVLLPGAFAVPAHLQTATWFRRLTTYLPLALLVLQLFRWASGTDLMPLAVEFAATLQVVRVATRRGAAHDQQIIILALLHLVAGTILGGGLVYGLAFLGFLIIAPAALVLSHLRREVEGNYRQGARDRTGLPVDVPRILRSRRVVGKGFLLFICSLSIPIFAFTALIFVMFPRVGLSLLLLSHNRPERMVGFSDRVDLGNVGRLRSDPTIALRVTPQPLPPAPPRRLTLYLRGTAFDQYDGKAWTRTARPKRRATSHGDTIPIRRLPGRATDTQLLITLDPIEPPVLFLPPQTVAVTVPPAGAALLTPPTTLWYGAEGELRYASFDDRGLRYIAHISHGHEDPDAPLTTAERSRYLTLAANHSARTLDLARKWVGVSADPYSEAQIIERRLRRDYKYDLDSPAGAASDPLDHFLFESKRGHCEFYSTAMAIMLRTLGVPSRNVTGFAGATYNRFGSFYAVRQGDAHSWVEAYIDGHGWTRFDPTPPSQSVPRADIAGVLASVRDLIEATSQRYDRHVVGYDLYQQIWLLREARREYTSLHRRSPVWRHLTSGGRIYPTVLGLVLATAALIWLVRKRRRRSAIRIVDAATPTALAAKRSIDLYSLLEASLAARGVPRAPNTPPLAHARALNEIGHPIGPQSLELTNAYLETRFGGAILSDQAFRSLARQAHRLRDPRLDPARSKSSISS